MNLTDDLKTNHELRQQLDKLDGFGKNKDMKTEIIKAKIKALQDLESDLMKVFVSEYIRLDVGKNEYLKSRTHKIIDSHIQQLKLKP